MEEQISYQSEIHRKLFHMCLIIAPVLYLFLSKTHFLMIILPICAVVIILDIGRGKYPLIKTIADKFFITIFRTHELDGKLCGVTYVAIAAAITFTFFSKVIALNAFTILAISDALASLIGRKYSNGEKFFEKSVIGSLTFFVSAFLILIIYGISFKEGFAYYLFGFLAVFATTVIEARPSLLKTDDNLTIPLTFSVVMFLFSLIWTYNY
jgi:dolichol kinase